LIVEERESSVRDTTLDHHPAAHSNRHQMVDLGQSDRNLSADELVAQHAPMKRLRPLFPNRIACSEYFARANAQQNTLEKATGPCCACRQEQTPCPSVVHYQWQARFSKGIGLALSFLGRVGVKLHYTKIEFQTFHPICQSCKSALRKRRGIANVLNFVGLMSVIVAALPAALGWAGAFYFDKREERTFSSQLAAMATGL
jgi:hypothetical protein